jgi:glycosylphosphatidylinositol transamidase (GPIT) subunit GPI8
MGCKIVENLKPFCQAFWVRQTPAVWHMMTSDWSVSGHWVLVQPLYVQDWKLNSCVSHHVVYRQKIDEQKTEIERLEHILDTKNDTEKKHIGMSVSLY